VHGGTALPGIRKRCQEPFSLETTVPDTFSLAFSLVEEEEEIVVITVYTYYG